MPRVHRVRIWGGVIFLFALGGTIVALIPPARRHAGKQQVSFAWPDRCAAVITETSTGGGLAGRLQFRLAVSRADARHLDIHFGDFRVLELGDVDTQSEAAHAELSTLTSMARLVPSFRVDGNGQITELFDVTPELQRCLAELTPEQTGMARSFMNSREFRRSLEVKSREYWQTWVTIWLGFALDTEHEARSSSRPTLFGVPAAQRSRIWQSEEVLDTDRVRLEAELMREGSDYVRALSRARRELNLGGMQQPDRISGQEVVRLEATLERSTGRPLHVRSQRTIELRGTSGDFKRVEETRSWTFSWTDAPSPSG